MKVKNVVIINDFNYIQGGASKVAIDTARLLKDENLNVYFFSAVHKKEEEIPGVEYITTNQVEALKNKNKLQGLIDGIYNFKAKSTLKKLLKKLDNKTTIIHIHGWTKALSSSVFHIAFKMNFKIVLTLHDYFSACPNGGYFNYRENQICLKRPLSFECLNCNCDSRNYFFKIYRIVRQCVQNKIVRINERINYAIGISELNIEILKKTLNSNIKIKKIFNPIEFDSNKKFNPNVNKNYLFIARISKDKGIDTFCKAITELGYKGIAIGEGVELERVKKEYPNIEFVGWKDKEDIEEYLSNSRCVVFPSLWYEGAPLTPLESMSYGIPCLVSNNCAGREYFPENNFSNYDELLKKLKEINNNNNINNDFTEVLKEFHPQRYKNSIINYYNDIIIENEKR